MSSSVINLTDLNGVVSYKEEMFGVQPTTEQIIKAKLVGLRKNFNPFDVCELVYEEADENNRNVNFSSDVW